MKKCGFFVGAWLLLLALPAFGLSPKQVYKKAGPAVVLILGSDGGPSGSGGTGSIITPEGKVITNAHVVISSSTGKPYKVLYVFLRPAKLTGDHKRDLVNRYKARVLSWSPAEQLDLALLEIINPPANLSTIEFANPDDVEVGDEVVAIGHPEQGGLWTLTTGSVSTVIANFGRVQGKNVFQTEASVNRGNSGGPLLDTAGRMIGVNSMVARKGAGGIAITGVNFALKSSVAVSWLAGAGMGLAYAKEPEEGVTVAMAPETQKLDSRPSAAPVTAAPVPAKPVKVKEPPPATIVVAEPPPKAPQKLRSEGAAIGKAKASEKVKAGKPLDPKKAKPTYHTEKRSFSLDDLRRQQMKELEDMMDDMRGKLRGKSKSRGMGLW